MRLIRAAECRRMAWKNGGGETTEVAVSPPGASLDDFDWRISVARVGVSGPFSIFPGVDRTLSVLGAAGVVLDFGDRGTVRLDRASAPYSFPADIAVEGRLIEGAVDDLNVMTRRGRFRHHVSRREVAGRASLLRQGDVLVVMAVQSGMRALLGGRTMTLAAGDAAVVEEDEAGAVDLGCDFPCEVFVIDLWRATREG